MPWKGGSLYKKGIVVNNRKAIGFKGIVTKAELLNGGTGYYNTKTEVLPTTCGTGSQSGPWNCKVNVVAIGGVVKEIIIASGGLGYSLNDILLIKSGGNNCTFKAVNVCL